MASRVSDLMRLQVSVRQNRKVLGDIGNLVTVVKFVRQSSQAYMAEQIRREIATMKLIKHPNVVQLYEVMASKTKILIILEYVTGGELFDKIVNDGRTKENEVRRYFQQLIHVVDYPHSRDGEDPEDEPMDDEDLKLSQNAMKGEQNESTFQVNNNIANGSGCILLGTLSTHDFIRSSVAKKLGIPIRRRPDRVVALADGGKCPVDGLCKGISMTVQGHQFEADCFAIPLSGFDVVLGIRCLNALGRVMWDVPARTIEFVHKDMMVKWHGEDKGPTRTLSKLQETGTPLRDGLMKKKDFYYAWKFTYNDRTIRFYKEAINENITI
ncbi:unnamed protein product [Arabidopsis arenosa]|uniref:Protein kinase domain-containing protein n=1 Tax=Arabidopsis arenosa TaxID=38785 RepID=A0A8S2A6J7_ARAAE|nr:unnamed protein product [Arabidopsis arenosa]